MIAGFIVGFVSTLVAYFITFGVKWIVEKPQKPVVASTVCFVCWDSACISFVFPVVEDEAKLIRIHIQCIVFNNSPSPLEPNKRDSLHLFLTTNTSCPPLRHLSLLRIRDHPIPRREV